MLGGISVFTARYVVGPILLLMALGAQATNGYFLHGYGVKAKGQAGASIALPQDGLAAASNPAGLLDVPDQFEVGVDAFAPRRGSTITQGASSSAYDGDDSKTFAIPDAALNHRVNERVAVALAFHANGGMNTDYGSNPYSRFGAQGSTGVDLSQAFLTPAVAVRVTDSQSLGIAVNLAYQRFKMKGVELFAAFSQDPAHVSGQGYDDSKGWGVRLGWQGHVGERVTLGATWQSKTYMSRFKKYAGLFADQGGFDIPETYGVGVAVTPNKSFSLALDWQRILYHDIHSVGNDISSLFQGVPLGATNGPGFGWRNISVVKLGASYKTNDVWTVRAGVSRSQQPIPASQTFFNVLAPGVVQTHATAGASWRWQARNELSFFYMHAFDKTVHGSNSIPAAFGGGEFDIHLKEDALGLSVSHAF